MTGWEAIWLAIELTLKHVETLQWIAIGALVIAMIIQKLRGKDDH